MGQIAATVRDAVDRRVFDCLLPDDEELGSLARRLAEILQYPVVGLDNSPVNYAFIPRGGLALDPHATFGEIELPRPLVMRLVPELVVGSDAKPGLASGENAIRQRSMLGPIDVREVTEPAEHSDGLTGLDVRIDASVHREIEKFAARNVNSECLGLLLGEVACEGKDRVISVKAVVPAYDARGSRTNVKMTIHAWESVLRAWDQKHPDLRAVGWFHTHAGWGVFMSDSDVFVHQNYFSDPDMVAYVLDPTVGRDGFFCRQSGKIALCHSFGLVCSPGERVPATALDGRKVRGLRRTVVGVLMAVMAIAVGVVIGWRVDLKSLRGKPELEQRQVAPAVAGKSESARETDVIITIAGGESLWEMCSQTYGDGSLAAALANYNNIGKRDVLRVGQDIRLPPRRVLEELGERR